jgi:hypothetical protein
MAQIKPEYEAIKEFRTISEKLVQKYPDVLEGVNAALISCVGVTNKDPKEGKAIWELHPVKYPPRLDCPYDYYVIVNMKDWDAFDLKHKALLAFDVLCSISREEPGKVVPFDLKDHAVVLRTVGVDYMKRADVPDILTDNIDWKKE